MSKPQNKQSLYKQGAISDREYKNFRNVVNNQIRMAKKKYYKKIFNENKNNLKQTWSVINKVLSKKEKKQN